MTSTKEFNNSFMYPIPTLQSTRSVRPLSNTLLQYHLFFINSNQCFIDIRSEQGSKPFGTYFFRKWDSTLMAVVRWLYFVIWDENETADPSHRRRRWWGLRTGGNFWWPPSNWVDRESSQPCHRWSLSPSSPAARDSPCSTCVSGTSQGTSEGQEEENERWLEV